MSDKPYAYRAWAENASGAVVDVNDGDSVSSIAEIKRIARAELGSGWRVHVELIHEDGTVMHLDAFTIRGRGGVS